MIKTYFVYILSNDYGTLYVGMTNNLERRIYEHKNGIYEGFTNKYCCHKLVYFESTNDVLACIEREKQLKRWGRDKKACLINLNNPEWKDLATDLM